jgi:hypothetical protein
MPNKVRWRRAGLTHLLVQGCPPGLAGLAALPQRGLRGGRAGSARPRAGRCLAQHARNEARVVVHRHLGAAHIHLCIQVQRQQVGLLVDLEVQVAHCAGGEEEKVGAPGPASGLGAAATGKGGGMWEARARTLNVVGRALERHCDCDGIGAVCKVVGAGNRHFLLREPCPLPCCRAAGAAPPTEKKQLCFFSRSYALRLRRPCSSRA